ncbi:MAG: four helix bundle protein [Candidatus Levybacteria bacterium]|nr:four helix bundle protein [Candidatus Levybacteria bacterium]
MNDQNNNLQKKYDLEERTARFAEEVIDLMKKISNTPINRRPVEQVVGSSGSMAANYCEANEAESKKDFIHKVCICKKETKETKLWLRLLARANPEFKEAFRRLWQEAQELLLIFSKIITSSRKTV